MVLLVLFTSLSCTPWACSTTKSEQRPLAPAEVAVSVVYRDAQGGRVVHESSAAAVSSPYDLVLDVSSGPLALQERAVLIMLDRQGRGVRAPTWLEPSDTGHRIIVALRALEFPREAAACTLIWGRASSLADLVNHLPAWGSPTLETAASTLAEERGLARRLIELPAPGRSLEAPPLAVDVGERLLQRGQFAAALATIDGLRGRIAATEITRAAVVGAEAAFGYGRTALALSFASAARSWLRTTDPTLEARLRRVEALAIAEGSEATEPPPERELLRASAASRPTSIEAALDAGVDLRLAMLHDRFSPGPRRAVSAGLDLIERAQQVPANEPRLSDLAGLLCRAGERVAHVRPDLSDRALRLGTDLATAADNTATQSYCSIAAGDRARYTGRPTDAETHFVNALATLGDAALPREQREAWFSIALLQTERGDYPRAFDSAQRAAAWVTRLLSLEVDIKAREALLINTVGYYGSAERIGSSSGDVRSALAVAEAGKGQALNALLHGSSEIDGAAIWPVMALSSEAVSPNAFARERAHLEELSRILDERDVLLSYTFLAMNSKRRFELAIGVLTRGEAAIELVELPDTFRSDVLALPEAVEANRGDDAKAIGARLYATLIQPVKALLARKDRLFISPHLRLHGLPWNALHDGREFLVHRFAFARSLPLVITRREPADDRPTFDLTATRAGLMVLDPPHPGFERLPGFDMLGADLASSFPATVLRGSQATARGLSAELPRADVFLFAGHAVYDPNNPLRSSLLLAPELAGDATPANDRLEARSLLGLRSQLKVAILLGCETARLWQGKPSYGDEAIGLSRAFLLAGARHVVGALWPVLDRDAEDFVRALVSNDDATDVVRHVQRAGRCLAEGRCASRGIITWGSYVVDAH